MRTGSEQDSGASDCDDPIKLDHDVLAKLVSRIEVQRTQLVISLQPTNRSTESVTLSIPWQKPPSKPFRKILMPHGALRQNIRPDRIERRLRLISAIARGRRWLEEIVKGSITDANQLAKRERCSVRQINLTLSLVFLCSSPCESSCRRPPASRRQYRTPAGSRPDLDQPIPGSRPQALVWSARP